MSCGTCGIQASNTMQDDTGVPAGAPQTAQPRCPHCKAFIAAEGAECRNPACPGASWDWPALALQLARANGPSEATRAAACTSPQYALLYAQDVDKGPHDDTRAAACRDPQCAWLYAQQVDQSPRDDTRAAACQSPNSGYLYAHEVDQSPRDDTRTAACQEPAYAWRYAAFVDRASRDDTRAAACRDPECAYRYMEHVDYVPNDVTRQAVAADPHWAAEMAEVDRQYQESRERSAAARAAAAPPPPPVEGPPPRTPHQAKKIIREALDRLGVPYTKLTARTIDFSDLARAQCVFVKIHGWQPSDKLRELEQLAVQHGFRVETDWFITGSV